MCPILTTVSALSKITRTVLKHGIDSARQRCSCTSNVTFWRRAGKRFIFFIKTSLMDWVGFFAFAYPPMLCGTGPLVTWCRADE